MIKLRLLAILAGTMLLAACSVTGPLEQLQRSTPEGSPFAQALAKEYQAFSEYEAYDMYDWRDQKRFAQKGIRAAAGEEVMPEDLADWMIPEDFVEELTLGRELLIKALDNGGRNDHPELAAKAQARYDCWMEQQEENHQPDHIEKCRLEFWEALADLNDAMRPPAAVVPVMAPSAMMIFFDFDKSDITDLGQQIVDSAASKGADASMISLTGHTDTVGSVEYNMGLSMRRAEAVRDALVAAGVNAANITLDAKGESEPLIETGDGVKTPQNRRVEIEIK